MGSIKKPPALSKKDFDKKEEIIKTLDEMECMFCGSTEWQEAEFTKNPMIVSKCDQCHTWDDKNIPHQILHS